ncbi:maleylpyruvate isomerase family mycothiol-dependent enzyme [Arthrobacter echini]|nr:maleylpyruvate isomerase family mycothiol-dependent enzyme [Arthrobacter echini]
MSRPSPYALPFDRYRELLDREYSALSDLVQPTLDRSVPACPGWNGEDLVRHTAIVFLHKAETIRTGEKPSHGWPPLSVGSLPPQALLAHCYTRLTEQFDSHEPADRAESWVPEDQTVGFWIRRLTLETMIHRFDLEEAAAGPTTPLDPDLALDGIDEVFFVMFVRGKPDPDASGGTIRLEVGAHSWDVRLDPQRAVVERDVPAEGQATLRAEAQEMLLWLWGRGPQPEGAPDTAVELRKRLARAL